MEEEMGLLRRDTSVFCTLVLTQAETRVVGAEDPLKNFCHKDALRSNGNAVECGEKQRLRNAEPSAMGTKET